MTAGDKLGPYEILGLVGKGGSTLQQLFPMSPFPGANLSADSFYVPMRDGQCFLVNAPTGGEAAAARPSLW
jgi:hypothetical protein